MIKSGDVDLVQKGPVTRLEEVAPDRLPRALVRANSDEELIRLWLDAAGAASENTMAAYKAETLRFLAWMRTRPAKPAPECPTVEVGLAVCYLEMYSLRATCDQPAD